MNELEQAIAEAEEIQEKWDEVGGVKPIDGESLGGDWGDGTDGKEPYGYRESWEDMIEEFYKPYRLQAEVNELSAKLRSAESRVQFLEGAIMNMMGMK